MSYNTRLLHFGLISRRQAYPLHSFRLEMAIRTEVIISLLSGLAQFDL